MLKDGWEKKLPWMAPLVVLIVLLISFGMYQWAIPRTELEVRTVYHEAFGGGGTGGTVNVNILLSNLGNRNLRSLECSVSVRLKDGGSVGKHDPDPSDLAAGENIEIRITCIGSHYETYIIDMDVRFDCSGNTHLRSLSYETREDTMTLVFVENIA
ncbi:MAG: hypothetical protein JW939_07195 [Candidatus Thermoplasmatota archaeon]|nr:hypothetical protein [Candidatus Thermoplasmatota archaeon]